jgi:hypothetical protein
VGAEVDHVLELVRLLHGARGVLLGTGEEEADRGLPGERVELDSALLREHEGFPGGGQDPELRAAGEPAPGDLGAGLHGLLAVVEEDQGLAQL